MKIKSPASFGDTPNLTDVPEPPEKTSFWDDPFKWIGEKASDFGDWCQENSGHIWNFLIGTVVVVGGAVLIIATCGNAAPVVAWAAATAWSATGTYVVSQAVSQDMALGEARSPSEMLYVSFNGSMTGAVMMMKTVFLAKAMANPEVAGVSATLDGMGLRNLQTVWDRTMTDQQKKDYIMDPELMMFDYAFGSITAGLAPYVSHLGSKTRGAWPWLDGKLKGLGKSDLGQEAKRIAKEIADYSEALWDDLDDIFAGKPAPVGGNQPKLSSKEIEAIKKYTGNDYENINNSLRGQEQMTSANKATTKNLQAALDKASIPNDTVVYRGTSTDGLGSMKNLPPDQLVGKTFTEPGFMSTSTSNSVATGTFQGNMQITIEVPAGAKGMDVSGFSQFPEAEILFQSGTEMYIKKADYDNGVLKLVVKILN